VTTTFTACERDLHSQEELEVPKPFKLEQSEAEALEKEVARLAADIQAPEPTTAIDKVFADRPERERVALSKRAFMFDLTLFGGGAAISLVANPLYELVRRYSADHNTGVDFVDRLLPMNLDDDLLDYVREKRRMPGLQRFEEEFPHADQKARFIVGLLRNFDNGGHATASSLSSLIHLLKLSSSPQTRFFLTDMLVAELTRLGRAGWARDYLTIDPSTLSARDRVNLLEKVQSVNYTSLSPNQYLSPETWNFHKALALFNDAVGDLIDMKITASDNGCRIDKLPKVNRETAGKLIDEFSAPGYYSVFWTIQQAAAKATGTELKEIAGLQYKFIQSFVPFFAPLRMELTIYCSYATT
jgi:hypothetical protein